MHDIISRTGDATIVKAIIALVHNLNLQVIAEGMEKEEQLCFLRDNQCDLGQGYFLIYPLKEEDMLTFLKTHQ